MEWQHLDGIRAPHRRPWLNGFTLVESLVTLALFGLLVTVGIGGFGGRLALARADAAGDALVQLLHEAREAAIRLNTEISVCPAGSDGDCLRDGGSQLLLFEDLDGNQQRQISEPLLRQYRPAGGSIAVRAAFAARSLKLAADGSATANGSLYYCPDDALPARARRIVLGSGGRVLAAQVEDDTVCGL